jgi:hypothetical protein
MNTREGNGSITIDATSGGGSNRRLNFHCYRVAGTLSNKMSIAILDNNGKHMADVVIDSYNIRMIMEEIGRLI